MSFFRPTALLSAAGVLFLLAVTTAGAQTKLLRFPDIHGDKVAFCYGGDIWTSPASGGLAAKITSHPGQEIFPKFSPDGKWIAFTGQYDGDEQVYVVPAVGGVPKQLTFYPAQGPLSPRWGYDHHVVGWTPDGKSVVFRALRDADGGRTLSALYTVTAAGGLPRMLPMPTSGAGDLSPDGKKIAYSPLFRDFRTWKRYQGGWAQDLYIFDLETNASKNFTNDPRSDRDPMWIGDKIYFSSDRDGTLNLYSYDITSESVEQLTRSTTWDVRWPSSDNESRIVYETNGELQIFDINSGQDQKISVSVPNDGVAMRPSRYPADKNIEDFELSPKGERALFVARGDVFTAPIEKGPTRNLTNSSNAHDKWARWSPDGKRIAFISDMTGEDEVYVIDQDGSSAPEQLTRGGKGMRYQPEWSPDGKRLAFSDKEGKIFVLTIETGELDEIAEEEQGLVRDYVWSPNGGHIAFSLADATGYDSIYIWSVADGQLRRVTSGMFDEFNPAWDPEGNYLYYISRREYAPQISDIEWNYAGNRSHGIFALALRKDVENPFPPESDEVTVEEEKEGEGGTEEDKKDEAEKTEDNKDTIQIDFDGLAGRAIRVPVEADNYRALSATKGHILYGRQGAFFYGRESYAKTDLMIYSIEDREASALAEDIGNYALSSDGSKVLVRQERSFNLYDAKPGAKDKKTVSTAGLMVDRVPSQEWLAIFDEAWRQYRDFFYVENMHGYDWEALREQYRPLVKHVAHRSDLNYVLGEMVAELNIGHTYIQGGDFEIPDRPKVGLPGARFELDEAAGRYRIAKIFAGQNEEERYRSPLTEVGVDAKVGDYVLAIDGVNLGANDNPYRHLQHKTHTVTLTLNDEPKDEGSRDVTYTPITSEQSLLYYNWVKHNHDYVAKVTDGRVGYLHIPDMGGNGIREFIKWYYPQIRKEGFVIDVRNNGGGNVSQWIIERLDSKLLATSFGSMRSDPGTYPATVFHGPMVCLLSETSASDGDIFPYAFRQAGLGPLIGKRSWGGVVGYSPRGPLLDGGLSIVPLSGFSAPDGEWIIEGHGVEPDIVVENDPTSVSAGKDPQLDRGIEEVLKAMKEKPMKLPARPPDPVKKK